MQSAGVEKVSKNVAAEKVIHQIRGGNHIIFFLVLHECVQCGYSEEASQQSTSNENHNKCSHGKIRKISVLFD